MNFNIFLCDAIPGVTFVSLGVAGLSVVMSIVMICAYIATRNSVIDIVTSFETQNSNSYEIRVNIFNRAITFLFNLESKQIDTNSKKIEAGEIFDNLLIVSSIKDTLSTFEKIIMIYNDQGILDIKLFNKFKACVRREFGAKPYTPKTIYSFAIPSGKITIGAYSPKQYVEGAPVKPGTAKAPAPYKAPNTPLANGATIVTQSQTENRPVPPVNPGARPVPPVGPGIRPVPPVNPGVRPVPPVNPGAMPPPKPMNIASMAENKPQENSTSEEKSDVNSANTTNISDNIIMAKPESDKKDDNKE